MDWLNKEQLRGIGSVAGGRGLGNAAEFVAMALAARMLGPAEYGKFAYFIAIAMVSGQLFDLGLGRILAVRTSLLLGANANDATVGRTYGALLGLRMYGVAVVPLLLAAALWERQFQLLLAGLAMGFLISTLQCLASIFQSQLQFGKYSASIWLPGVAHLAGVVALKILGLGTLKAILLLYPLAQLLCVCLLMSLLPWNVLDWGAMRRPQPELKLLFDFGRWLMLAAMFEVVYLKADVMVLKWLGTPHELGIYAAAFTFAGLFNLICNAVMANYVPLMCRAAGQGRIDKLRQYYRESTDLLAMVVMPAAVGLWAISPTLMPMLFGSKYQASSSVWAVLVIFSILMAINSTGGVFFALQQLRAVAFINFTVVVANVTFCSLLASRYGAIGAAWGVSLGAAVWLSVSWTIAYRMLRTVPDLRSALYYLFVSLLFSPLVRLIGVPSSVLNLVLKIATGVVVYVFLLWIRRVYLSDFEQTQPDCLEESNVCGHELPSVTPGTD